MTETPIAPVIAVLDHGMQAQPLLVHCDKLRPAVPEVGIV